MRLNNTEVLLAGGWASDLNLTNVYNFLQGNHWVLLDFKQVLTIGSTRIMPLRDDLTIGSTRSVPLRGDFFFFF